MPCQAIELGRCLEIHYDEHDRIIEVHAVGYTKNGNLVMRVWQVKGGSESGQTQGWKLMSLDKVQSMSITDEVSEAPREGYNRSGDSAMDRILCKV